MGRGDDFERRRDRPGRGGGGRRDEGPGGGDDLRDRMRERFDRVDERLSRL